MCGNTKMQNTGISELPKFTIPMFRKSQNLKVQCLEKGQIQNSSVQKKSKFRISMFGKSQKLEFQCLEKPKFRFPMFGKGKI